MTTLLGFLRGRGWLEKQNDPTLAQSHGVSSLQESKDSLLDMRSSHPTISQASSLPNYPPRSSLPLTWKDIDATAHPVRLQLEAIIADRDSKPWQTVAELHPDQFQVVMDELQLILDHSSKMKSDPFRTTAIKCLQAIGSLFDGLPASMMIQDVIQESITPSRGGGYADVWLGRVGSQRVALKVLRIFGDDGNEEHMKTSKAFRREALLWHQLQHPRILPLLGVNTKTFSPRPCLVSPYMYNGNLYQFLQKNPTHDRLRMLIEIMDGIDFLHAHDRPLVHGDIRGANILVKEDLTCYISDFGLSMVIDSRTASSMLRKGATRWLAPEILRGSDIEYMPSRDIYAFGCTTIEICGLKAPFPNIHGDAGIILAVIIEKKKPPPTPTTLLPQRVWDIIDRCLAYEAKHRPNAKEILATLKVIYWKEETWYDFRMMLKDTKLLKGTPFRASIVTLTAVIDTIHDVLDNLKQEFITAHLIPFIYRLENLLRVMKDKKYLHADIDPAPEHINSILRDAKAALERTQRSINTVEANEYQRQVEDIIRRVDEAATAFELELASASDRQIHPGRPRSSLSHLHNLTAPVVFALTIGIDEHRHESFRSYSGCVADADDMVNVLVKTLHVPLTHITNLRNENATAARITAAFESLAVDKRITKNANIIIFYAGHCIGLETGACDT